MDWTIAIAAIGLGGAILSAAVGLGQKFGKVQETVESLNKMMQGDEHSPGIPQRVTQAEKDLALVLRAGSPALSVRVDHIETRVGITEEKVAVIEKLCDERHG